MSISAIRREYHRRVLRRKDLDPDPFDQFRTWFRHAVKAQRVDPNAMVLATADSRGRPSARTLLLKGLDDRGFAFYTNYRSRKGRELATNRHAALVFYWPVLERQVCITGHVSRIPRRESEAYFSSRPRLSRLAAWVSSQSHVIAGRAALDEALERLVAKYRGRDVPLPPYWGGYCLCPVAIEFWQGRPNRLHDRFLYTRRGKRWLIQRLAP